MTHERIELFTDGGSRGNPGPAALGVYLRDLDSGKEYRVGKYLGHATNNQAEYQALVVALEKAHDLGAHEVTCYLDSELVVKQMKGEYKVKDAGLRVHFETIKELSKKFKKFSIHHVRREKNKEADAVVNEVLDQHAGQ